MTIRGKVLLFVAVASSLIAVMGLSVYRSAAHGRRMREWSLGTHEQRYLYSQLRGDALVFLADLQRVHGSGAVSEAVLKQYLRRVEGDISRLRTLLGDEARWDGEDHSGEVRHLERLEQALRHWAGRAEARIQQMPSAIGTDGAHPQASINEFSREVEPLLAAALEIKHDDLKALDAVATRGLRTSLRIALIVPVASLALLLGLAWTILVPMSRRLRELLAGAEHIGQGKQGVALPETHRDEFGELARGLNKMSREISATQARLLVSDRLASLGRTVASVGHEINNPVAYVLSNLAFVREELGRGRAALSDKDEQELLEALAEARDGAERVRFIAQDLTSLSRADDTTTVPVDLQRVVRGVARMASHELRRRARLVERCEGVPPVRANATRLVQVLLNLIINAAHAIPEGNAEQNEVQVTARVSGPGQVRVDVSDTGCGIPAENLERIFEPFFTTKPEGQGTGLGLAVCRNIITALGGTITVESQVGQGTTFHITLPAAVDAAVA